MWGFVLEEFMALVKFIGLVMSFDDSLDSSR